MASRCDIVLIGRGRIARDVAEGLAGLPGYRLLAMVGRADGRLPAAPLIIEAAGPDALRQHGAAALCAGELWTVGAAALLDDGLRGELAAVAAASGHALRLFTPWIAGISLCPPVGGARLWITQSAPRLAASPGLMFRGPLAEAGRLYPDHLNTATAAALCGPGIEATRITLRSAPDVAPHRIAARLVLPGQTIRSEALLRLGGRHPVAEAILAALARRGDLFRFG